MPRATRTVDTTKSVTVAGTTGVTINANSNPTGSVSAFHGTRSTGKSQTSSGKRVKSVRKSGSISGGRGGRRTVRRRSGGSRRRRGGGGGGGLCCFLILSSCFYCCCEEEENEETTTVIVQQPVGTQPVAPIYVTGNQYVQPVQNGNQYVQPIQNGNQYVQPIQNEFAPINQTTYIQPIPNNNVNTANEQNPNVGFTSNQGNNAVYQQS